MKYVRLTTREIEVLQLYVNGHTPRTIGVRLDMCRSRVTQHLQNIKNKLGALSSHHIITRLVELNIGQLAPTVRADSKLIVHRLEHRSRIPPSADNFSLALDCVKGGLTMTEASRLTGIGLRTLYRNPEIRKARGLNGTGSRSNGNLPRAR